MDRCCCVDEEKCLLRYQESNGTHPTLSSSSSQNNSLDNSDDLYPITGCYSDIYLDYSLSPDVLGSGRYGKVRKCTHLASGKSFAVKSIQKAKVENLEYLKREVAVLSKMNHEHIIKMIDCYEDAEYVHIVSEHYTGGELFDKILVHATPDGCLPEDKVSGIIKQVLKAVSYLHEQDFVHRDLKPENILFESSEESSSIRLIDFGFACHHSQDEPKMASRVGTCIYMSPELIRGNYDRASDIYSVGVIAYILFCGYAPFNGNDDREVANAILAGEYTFVHGWDGVSEAAMDFLKCLLNPDPRQRLTANEALMHPWMTSARI